MLKFFCFKCHYYMSDWKISQSGCVFEGSCVYEKMDPSNAACAGNYCKKITSQREKKCYETRSKSLFLFVEIDVHQTECDINVIKRKKSGNKYRFFLVIFYEKTLILGLSEGVLSAYNRIIKYEIEIERKEEKVFIRDMLEVRRFVFFSCQQHDLSSNGVSQQHIIYVCTSLQLVCSLSYNVGVTHNYRNLFLSKI
jgi:hypothetical protein